MVPFVNRLPPESQTHFNPTLRTKYFRKITKAVFNQRCLRTKPVEMHPSAKAHYHQLVQGVSLFKLFVQFNSPLFTIVPTTTNTTVYIF